MTRGAFVAGGDELEEQVGGFGFEGDVADFVDDEERVAAEAAELVVEAAWRVGVAEAVDPFGGGGERDAVAGLAGADARARWRGGSCRCRAGRGTRRCRGRRRSRGCRGGRSTSRLRERWWSKSKSSRLLRAGNRAARMRSSPPLVLAGGDLAFEAGGEELFMGPASVRARSASRSTAAASDGAFKRPAQVGDVGGRLGRAWWPSRHPGRPVVDGEVAFLDARRRTRRRRCASARIARSARACSGAAGVWCLARQRRGGRPRSPSQVTMTSSRVTRTSTRRPTKRGLTE